MVTPALGSLWQRYCRLIIEFMRFGDDGQRIAVYQAEPGSADEAELGRLAAR